MKPKKIKELYESTYKKILSRPDGRRPRFVSELTASKIFPPDGLVMSISVLHPDGSSTSSKWTQKSADRMLALEKAKVSK